MVFKDNRYTNRTTLNQCRQYWLWRLAFVRAALRLRLQSGWARMGFLTLKARTNALVAPYTPLEDRWVRMSKIQPGNRSADWPKRPERVGVSRFVVVGSKYQKSLEMRVWHDGRSA